MNRRFYKIISIIILVFSMILLGACTQQNQMAEQSNQQNQTEEKPKRFSNPDEIEEEMYVLTNLDSMLVEHEDYYELQNACIAKRTDYKFDYSMFENAEAGKTLTLPNGEFRVKNIYFLEDSNETHIELENDFFLQYVVLLNESKSVQFIGAGEFVQFEVVTIENLRFSKDCVYNMIINDEFEYGAITLAEAIAGEEYDLKDNELFVYIDKLDENKDIIEITDVFIP